MLQKMHIPTIIVGTLFFFLFTSFLGFYSSIRPPRIISTLTPEAYGLSYEDVAFKTEDGLTLKGWFVPRVGEETKRTIILLHGYPADKGDLLYMPSFLSEDFNLFLFDFRYFGESEGRYSTAGTKEVLDLLAAVSYLKGRGIEEVGVWGFSMGGAVALMGQERAPEITAVVSEAAYANLGDLATELYRIPYLNTPLAYLTILWGKILLGADADRVSPESSVSGSKIPILIIHSRDDGVIPFKNALQIQNALKQNPHAEFWFGENLVHGAFADDYGKRVKSFFEKSL